MVSAARKQFAERQTKRMAAQIRRSGFRQKAGLFPADSAALGRDAAALRRLQIVNRKS